MKKILALLVALTLVMSGIVAVAEAAPVEITVGVGSQFTTLDNGLNTETINSYALYYLNSMLMATDKAGIPYCDLAESYEISEDGLHYTFHLRNDIVWSDGEPLVAGHFEYAILRALSYGPENAFAVNGLNNYMAGAQEYNLKALDAGKDFDCLVEPHDEVGFKAVDDYTIEITLAKPCAFYLKSLAGNVYAPLRPDFAPQHESLWAMEGGYPVVGAYSLEECNENEKCVLVKNPNYHKADEITVDQINMIVMPDSSAQSFAFMNGELDVSLSVSSEVALANMGSDSLWLVSKPSNYFLAINSGSTGPEWAKDVNIRRALALAIDKEAVAEVLGGTELYPVLNGYVPHGHGGVEKDFRVEGDEDGYTLVYDPEQAKALLAEAGYDASNPLHIVYKYSNNGIHGDVATMLQAFWQAVGIDCEFAAVESGVFYDQLDAGDFEIARYGLTSTTDPISWLQLWTTSMQVVAAVDDPVLDQKVADAEWITDPAAYYTELHNIEDYMCEENVYVIPMFDYTTPVQVQSNISNYYTIGANFDFAHVVIE